MFNLFTHVIRSRKLHLRTTLVVPFVVQILTVVGVVGYFSFRSGQQSINHLANQLLQEINARIDKEVANYLAVPTQVQAMNLRAIETGSIETK